MWEPLVLRALSTWLWWFGNKDEPRPPVWYEPGEPYWKRFVMWYFRNPLHNFTHYIVNAPAGGELITSKPVLESDPVFAEEGGWLYGYRDVPGEPDFPWISYKQDDKEFWMGWHPTNGKLGSRGFPPLWGA